MLTKEEIRAAMKAEAAVRLTGREECLAEARLFWSKVEALPEFSAAHTVLAFMSLPDEVPTAEFIGKWAGCKRIAIPRVVSDGVLELREYRPDCLREGYKGIPEPTEEAPEVKAEEVGLALVPGVAFDRNGGRLGRGKGFYDRLLPRLKCPSVAVCQSWRIIGKVPSDQHDAPVDIVL